MSDESAETRLVPLLVDGVGRGGTTLMMQLLGTSPQIAFDRWSPYERRYFTYLLEWSRVLERRVESTRLWPGNATNSLPAEHGLVGPIPWRDRSLVASPGEGPAMSERCFQLVWQEFSARAAANTRARFGGSDGPVRYFAEKTRATWRLLDLEFLQPMKVLALVRDPRDVWLSSVAFNEKRGARGFARVHARSEEEALSRFTHQQRRRLRWLAKALDEGEVPVVRYEDLVSDLAGTARRIEEHLDVRLDPEAVLRERDAHERHMTAKTPEASVGRWRDEMRPDLATLFAKELGEDLEALGYDRGT
jgi:hypothetical protein